MKKVIAALQTLLTASRFRVNAVGFCGKIVTELYGQIQAYAYGLQMIGNPVPVIAARA
jgi:hypothetical protein